MLTLLISLIEIAALALSFWKLWLAWVIISGIALFLLVALMAAKRKKFHLLPALSPEANLMLQKFGHYYFMPHAGQDFSSSASGTGFALAVLSAITAYKVSWWYLGLAVIAFGAMGFIARGFNPTRFLIDDQEKKAHNEIVSHLTNRTTEP